MNKMWKRLLAVSLAVLLLLSAPMGSNIFAGFALTASAASYSGTCGENLTWTLDTDTGILAISGTGEMKNYSDSNAPWYSNRSSIREVQIANGVTSIGKHAFYNCTSLTSVTIPDSVTSIGDDAFSHCTSLTSVTIPDSVTSIGDDAFYDCTSLTSVTIPDSVTSIGDEAFYYCTSLPSVTIPDSVTSIGVRAFSGCTSLTSITVKEGNPNYSNDEYGVLLNKDKTLLIQYPVGNTRTSYTIPDSVTSIGAYAFYKCTSLTSVTIPDSVTSIGKYAFFWCTSLTSITIPDSVTSIGNRAFYKTEIYNNASNWENDVLYIGNHLIEAKKESITGDYLVKSGIKTIADDAFYNCTSLTSVTIPDSVTSIGEYVFWGCTSLTSITVKEGNPNYSSDEYGVLLNKDKTLLIQYPFGNTRTSYTIPDSVTSIGDYAFYKCTGLTSVTIPDSVTSIGDEAFWNCTRLTSVTIPDSVTSIGSSAFYWCTSLTSVTIGDSVTSIGDWAFDGCTSLTSVTIGDSVTRIGVGAFYECTHLTSVTIPDSVTSIGNEAFYYCTRLTSVTIGDSVTSIGSSAFSDCTSLTSVTIGDSVTSIGGYAFYCTHLTSVTIPDSVTSIGNEAFYYCTRLTSVTIGDSVTSIGERAFWGCTSLTSITVKEGNPNYSSDEYGVLLNKDKTLLIQYPVGNTRTSYTIPDSVTSIGKRAFEDCASLTSITIPDSVTSIGYSAFYKCTSLTSVTIPDSVTSIGERAFYGCTSLTSVTIPDSVTSIGDYVFYNCTRLTSVTIPDSVTSIGHRAFSRCTSLNYVHIPASVTSIGESILYESSAYICSDTAECYAKKYAEANGIEFRVCEGHIPPHDHNYVSSVTAPTCTEQGYTTHTCTTCGDTYTDSVVDALGHSYKSVVTAPTCTEQGYTTHTCTVCGDTYTDSVVDALGHSYKSVVTAPTCTEQGYTTHTCTACGDTYTDSLVDALGHAYDSAVTKEATCTEKGEMTYTCSRCGDSYTEDIAEIPHTEKTVRIEPTCTADGKQYTACSVCGATLGTVTVLPMIDHAFGEWVTVTEPTLEAEGLQERTCTYGCGTKETQVLPKIPSKTAEDEDSGVTLTYPDAAYEGDVELKVSQVFDGTAFNLVALNSDKNVVYDITTMKDGVAVQPSCTVIVRIPVPAGFDPAKCIVYHVSTETGKLERMPARYESGYMVFETTHFSYYAIAIEKTPQPVVAIRNFAENRTIDYRTTLTFNATVEYGVDGGEIHWFVDGKDVGTGDTYTVKEAKKNFTVQAKYMDGDKVLAESEIETVKVKSGFFDKLIAFFRALFKKLPVLTQEYLGIERITTR